MNHGLDLLYPEATLRVARPLIERALVFAFASGDTAGAFERVLENATLGPSNFKPESFARDLFLEQFVQRCLPIRIGATTYVPCKPYLTRVLSMPPVRLDAVEFRQAILSELGSDRAQRDQFETLYQSLHELRGMLSAGDYATRADQNLRRLDILRCIHRVFVQMATSHNGAQSALSRIRGTGKRVVESDAFEHLSELLSYEQHLATVDLRVRLGSDGTVRAFDLLGHRENVGNRFYSNWLGRWWARFEMFLKGYRFSQHEILTRLLEQTFEGIRPELSALFQLLGDMEVYLAMLGFMDAAEGARLKASLPEWASESSPTTAFSGLYNPFLVAEGVQVQSCDIEARADAIVVVTGPNSGGKTRLLQSVALSQLLAQGGFPVPAERARLVVRPGLFVSLLDDIRADQEEGRLGMELVRIRRLFEQINVGDMVVFDELCSGTNPSEGEEIFRLVVELLGQLHPQIWLTTHFLQFASRLREGGEPEQLLFLRAKLDAQEHPTFTFEEGVARTSFARQTAARLGVTWDELATLVERAKNREPGSA
ncbi:MAG TPA: DNA mismatch repair protein [Polyangiaceae bacterium]|jgi:DNA mismatch repair protein MutS2|nr:DNA mismatch repair protein [Polyangiaceae bacterium]